jgi:predicted nucleotidyltransferase
VDLDGSIAAVLSTSPSIVAGWVFGSVARGVAREDSDLDVAVLLSPPAAAEDRRTLYDLAARLEQAAGRRVDLVILGDHDPIIAHRVLSEGRLVFCRDRERRIDFESRTHMRYIDWVPNYERAARRSLEVNRAWAEERDDRREDR